MSFTEHESGIVESMTYKLEFSPPGGDGRDSHHDTRSENELDYNLAKVKDIEKRLRKMVAIYQKLLNVLERETKRIEKLLDLRSMVQKLPPEKYCDDDSGRECEPCEKGSNMRGRTRNQPHNADARETEPD